MSDFLNLVINRDLVHDCGLNNSLIVMINLLDFSIVDVTPHHMFVA